MSMPTEEKVKAYTGCITALLSWFITFQVERCIIYAFTGREVPFWPMLLVAFLTYPFKWLWYTLLTVFCGVILARATGTPIPFFHL